MISASVCAGYINDISLLVQEGNSSFGLFPWIQIKVMTSKIGIPYGDTTVNKPFVFSFDLNSREFITDCNVPC